MHYCTAYNLLMKSDKFPQNQKPAGSSHPIPVLSPSQNETNFISSSDEVARRAYFAYVNQGSPQGHEAQHWLQAEAELVQERNLTRGHHSHHWNLK